MNENIFKQMLKEKKLKVTRQRLLVLELMAAHPGEHLTAEEIYALAQERYPEIGLATIYRILQVLVDLQLLDKLSLDDGFARYELSQLPGEAQEKRHHHHHAICSGCGTVFSFEEDLLDTLEQSLRERLGFVVTDHEVKLFGYCRSCIEKQKDRHSDRQIMEVID